MSRVAKIVIVVALVAAVAGVIVIKQVSPKPASDPAQPPPATAVPAAQPAAALPRLVDLGSTTCIPCKMMAPVLEELKKEYEGRLQVEFVDVNVNPGPAREYGIKLIPTQIFFDASCKERFRHEGFFSKEDILAKWKELGVDLSLAGAAAPPQDRMAPATAREGNP